MRSAICAATLAAAACAAPLAHAGVFADDLSRCMTQKATKEDKLAFIRWMFGAIALNPAVTQYSTITASQRDMFGKEVTQTFERVLLVDCRKETVAALKNEGEMAVLGSFEFFGRTATMELLSDPNTIAELQKMDGASDEAAWDKLYAEVGRPRRK